MVLVVPTPPMSRTGGAAKHRTEHRSTGTRTHGEPKQKAQKGQRAGHEPTTRLAAMPQLEIVHGILRRGTLSSLSPIVPSAGLVAWHGAGGFAPRPRTTEDAISNDDTATTCGVAALPVSAPEPRASVRTNLGKLMLCPNGHRAFRGLLVVINSCFRCIFWGRTLGF